MVLSDSPHRSWTTKVGFVRTTRIRVVFKHSYKPDRLCERIVHQCARNIFASENNTSTSASELSRFFLIGEIAVDLLLHTEELSVKAKKLRVKAQKYREK